MNNYRNTLISRMEGPLGWFINTSCWLRSC